jgi:hypothetical protein
MLFTGTEQVNYCNGLRDLFPHGTITASDQAYEVSKGLPMQMAVELALRGARKSAEKFLQKTTTTALMIIHAGQLRYQNYWLSGGATDTQATAGEMATLEYFRAIAPAVEGRPQGR